MDYFQVLGCTTLLCLVYSYPFIFSLFRYPSSNPLLATAKPAPFLPMPS